jgi:ribosomal protein L11 methyltransferase
MHYVELAFTVPLAASEECASRLYDAGVSGVEERDATTYDRAPDGCAVLVAWVDPDGVAPLLERLSLDDLGDVRVEQRDRDDDEWRDAWKRHFTARRVGRFVIVPSWERYAPREGEIVLDLDPGRAFGTGGHASTRLCLEAIGEFEPVQKCLDVGCGSGVLAIAVMRRFPEARGVGMDVDADALDVSRENAERNHVAERLTFTGDPIDGLGEFDLVLANIEPHVLIPMVRQIAARVAPGGQLVLSGILVEAAPPVDAAYREAGLEPLAHHDGEGWRALRYRRPR